MTVFRSGCMGLLPFLVSLLLGDMKHGPESKNMTMVFVGDGPAKWLVDPT